MCYYLNVQFQAQRINISLGDQLCRLRFFMLVSVLHTHTCQDITALSHIVFTLNIVLSLFPFHCWAFIIDSKPSMKEMKMIGWFVDDRWLMILSPNFTSFVLKHILVPVFCCVFIACRICPFQYWMSFCISWRDPLMHILVGFFFSPFTLSAQTIPIL